MMNLIYIVNTSKIRWNDIEHYRKYLSDATIDAIESINNEEDKCNSLVPRLILLCYLRRNKLTICKNKLTISYTETGKPFITDLKELHFNISHTSHYVVCAISSGGEIGVDIEIIKNIDIYEFTCVFTKEEFSYIKKSANQIFSFYTLWTLKEALLKALGQGFNIDPQMFDVLCTPFETANRVYHLKSIIWDTNYILSICTINGNQICITKLSLNDILQLL